ncbi:hypothetical protein [Mycobacterium sp.]|uniref:hypothetical protein n=1 Tax=Mycobacterium sp. TaxID=1785 RepID=UPI0031DDE8B8
MTGQPHALLSETAVPTVEADLTDWAEQHQAVVLPDDDYPHVGHAEPVADSWDRLGRNAWR